jgi:hypothetical protein
VTRVVSIWTTVGCVDATTGVALYPILAGMLPLRWTCYTEHVPRETDTGGGDGPGATSGASCPHPEVVEGRCTVCGACAHDVVLNGACYFCGETDLSITVRPVDREARDSAVIPAHRLRRGRP